MTVGELIEKLKEMPQDTVVVAYGDEENGAWGEISTVWDPWTLPYRSASGEVVRGPVVAIVSGGE